MKHLIYSGLLYLAGVSVVLYLKPELMFNKDGEWKEFGLGRNQEQYTWLPFWLFTILWAMVSYLIVTSLTSVSQVISSVSQDDIAVTNETIEPENVSIKALSSSIKKRPANVGEMKKGYYILDMNETAKKGIPKYIYLGPESPNLLFHDQTQ